MAAVDFGPLFQGDGDDCQEVELSANDKSYPGTQQSEEEGLQEPGQTGQHQAHDRRARKPSA